MLNKVLHEKQYGFIENSTTKMTVNQVVDELTEASEKKLINCSVVLDLAKALNIVDHNILI